MKFQTTPWKKSLKFMEKLTPQDHITVLYVSISNILFIFHFISIFIHLNHRKASDALYIGKEITPTCFRRYHYNTVWFKFFIWFFWCYRDMTEIWSYCLRPPSRVKCHKVSFPRTRQNGASRFRSKTVSITITALS